MEIAEQLLPALRSVYDDATQKSSTIAPAQFNGLGEDFSPLTAIDEPRVTLGGSR
jgi:hypothetical protein